MTVLFKETSFCVFILLNNYDCWQRARAVSFADLMKHQTRYLVRSVERVKIIVYPIEVIRTIRTR